MEKKCKQSSAHVRTLGNGKVTKNLSSSGPFVEINAFKPCQLFVIKLNKEAKNRNIRGSSKFVQGGRFAYIVTGNNRSTN